MLTMVTFLWRIACGYFLILFVVVLHIKNSQSGKMCNKRVKFYICMCMSLCVPVCMSIYLRACVRVCAHIVSSVLYTGPLECCCGKYFLLDTCHTLAKATRKFWSSSPAEDGWTHLRTVLGPCMTLLGTFLQVAKDDFPFQKILQPHMLF